MNYKNLIDEYQSEIKELNSEIETKVSKLNGVKESLDNAITEYNKLLMKTIVDNIDAVKDLANKCKDITFNGYYSNNYHISNLDVMVYISDGMYEYRIEVSKGTLKCKHNRDNDGIVTKEIKYFLSNLEMLIYKLAGG